MSEDGFAVEEEEEEEEEDDLWMIGREEEEEDRGGRKLQFAKRREEEKKEQCFSIPGGAKMLFLKAAIKVRFICASFLRFVTRLTWQRSV